MTSSGHILEPGILVAASLLRLGSDTRAARVFAEMRTAGLPPAAAVLRQMAARLGVPADAQAAMLATARADADRLLACGRTLGLSVVSALDAEYPPLLEAIPDPPIILWVAGDPAVLSRPTVALVGSRQATAGGLATARRLGRDLARAGVTVVSGLARGIDGAAHRGALDGGGPTVAVLGSGPDVVYPRAHEALALDIRSSGAIVAEFPPGTPPLARHFPLRNRIISGLAAAVVVVEASDKSGSLITARLALEQGRDVLAVPGNIISGCYRGCHGLIKDGAGLVETVEDILDALGGRFVGLPRAESEDNSLSSSNLEAFFRSGEAISIDELAVRAGRPAAEVMAELGRLEVAGRVTRMAGGLFARLD